MMCYHGYRTDNPQGMRMIGHVSTNFTLKPKPEQPKGRPPKKAITEELLKQIEAAIANGDTFVNQAKLSGFTPDALKTAWRRSGRRVRGTRHGGLPATILIDTIHEFALWCEGRGMSIKKSADKRIVWSIQIMEGGRLQYRAIRKKDGKFGFSNGVAALFKRFLKEREGNEVHAPG